MKIYYFLIDRRKIVIYFTTLLFLHFSSCNTSETVDSKDVFTLQTKDYIKFPLDHETGKYHFAIQAFKDNTGSYFSFFNRNNNELYIYNYQRQTLVKKIPFEYEGPNGIGDPAKLGYLIVSFDSIFLYNASNFRLMLSDGKGKIARSFNLNMRNLGIYTPFPDVRTLKPIFLHDKKIFLTSLKVGIEPVPDHTKLDNVIILDLETGEIGASQKVRRSSVYNEGQWGALFYYQLFSCFNPHTNKFVYSFGLDHNLYETDHQDFIRLHKVKSKFFSKDVKPLAKDKDLSMQELPIVERTEYDFTSPSYFAILYDPYKKLYYRFVTPPLTTEEFKNDKPLQPVVMILDEHFQTLGETRLPPEGIYHYSMMFINEKGLHIMHDNGEEDFLYFVILQAEKI